MGARLHTDLLIGMLGWAKAGLEEVPKDDGATGGKQVLGAANSTAQVLGHQLQQDAPQVALVLVVDQAVMEDAQAFMQPQAHQGLLAVALLGTGHQHALHLHSPSDISCSLWCGGHVLWPSAEATSR